MSAVSLDDFARPAGRPLKRLYRRLLAVPLPVRVGTVLVGSVAALGAGQFAPGAAVLLAGVLGASVVSDVLWRRIFNWVTGPALLAVAAVQLAGVAAPSDNVDRTGTHSVLCGCHVQHGDAPVAAPPVSPARTGLPDAEESLAGFGLCLGLMVALYLAFRGGEGDVKLVALVGAIVGPRDGVEVAVAGYLLASGAAALILAGRFARRALTGRRPDRPLTAGTLPMAPFFALGAALCPPGFGGAW